MRRFWAFALAAVLLSGCRIEQTPPEYIDSIEIPAADIAAVQDEIGDRLRSTALALQRRSLNELLAALAPSSRLSGIGPGENETIEDGTSLGFALSEATAGRQVRIEEVEVYTGPRNNTAWFHASYVADSSEPSEAPVILRFSGVFLRDSGDWRLVQAHISRAFTPPSNRSAGVGTESGA